MECPHCEALQNSARENRTAIVNLAAATNGKLDRVHLRIDKLMLLAIGTLCTSTGALVMVIIYAVLGRVAK